MDQPSGTARKDSDNADRIGDRDSTGSIHEKWFRHNVDQKVGIRVEHPQVIVKENMVKNNKVLIKICGDDTCEDCQNDEKQNSSDTDCLRKYLAHICL